MYTYIIVDDEAFIRKGLMKKIDSYRSSPLQCIGEADNGLDALELVSANNPHIIFTDMRMPGMDGKQLMRNIREQYPDIKMIVISGYSDFEYMQEAISSKAVHYLLKPFSREEIHDALDKAVAQLQAEQSVQQEVRQRLEEHEQLLYQTDIQTLTDIVVGRYSGPSEAIKLQSKALAELQAADKYVLLTVYSPLALHPQTLCNNRAQLYLPHPQSEHLGFVLAGFPSYEDGNRILQSINKLAEQYIGELSVSIHTECCIGSSSIVNQLSSLNEAHQQCISALDQRTITDFGKHYRYTEQVSASEPSLWDKVQVLLYDLESGRTAKVNDHILDLFAFYRSMPNLYLYQVKNQCRAIIVEVKRIIAMHWKTESNMNSSSSLEAMLKISFDLETMKAYFLQALTGISELMKEQGIYTNGHVIENVRSYIQNHYMRELTLEKLSSLFYLNPSYLSYLFKEYTAQNLTDYINEVRIEHAKRLLLASNDKIYKIAKTLGYDNEKYFFRVFKKTTGLTPEQYRKQQEAGN